VCAAANSLNFCNGLNNRYVSSPYGQSPNVLDTSLSAFFTSIVNNPNVLSSGTTASCRTDLTTLLCTTQFPYCGQSTVVFSNECYENCVNVMQVCGLTVSHQALFNCSSYPTCSNRVVTSTNGASQVSFDKFWIAIAPLFATLLFFISQ
jgi:hypothetical protein